MRAWIIITVQTVSLLLSNQANCFCNTALKGYVSANEQHAPDQGTALATCQSSFDALPAGFRHGSEEEETVLKDLSNGLTFSAALVDYEEKCTVDWDHARPSTKAFFADTLGLLTYTTSAGPQPVCSAFRIAKNLVLTANHCLYERIGSTGVRQLPLKRLRFRLVGDPQSELEIVSILDETSESQYDPAYDFRDFRILRISDTAVPFCKLASNFRSGIGYGRWVAVIGFDVVLFQHQQYSLDDWPKAISYSRLAGNVRYSPDQLKAELGGRVVELSEEAKVKCLYYRSPTFGAKSGTAVLSFDRTSRSSDVFQLYIGGLHLREGYVNFPNGDCASEPTFNMGLALPRSVTDLTNMLPK